jgi:hypothetical protein
MIYYTINKIIDVDEDGWQTSEQIVYSSWRLKYSASVPIARLEGCLGKTITFEDLETAKRFYALQGFTKSTHHISIHETDDPTWAKKRFYIDKPKAVKERS